MSTEMNVIMEVLAAADRQAELVQKGVEEIHRRAYLMFDAEGILTQLFAPIVFKKKPLPQMDAELSKLVGPYMPVIERAAMRYALASFSSDLVIQKDPNRPYIHFKDGDNTPLATLYFALGTVAVLNNRDTLQPVLDEFEKIGLRIEKRSS